MRTLYGIFLVTALASSGVRADAVSETVTVDENGNGSITNPSGTTPLVGTLMPDPSSNNVIPGGMNLVLVYPLPFLIIPGDVVLTEPGTTEPANSDLIRFVLNPNSAATNPTGLLLFYSELGGPGEVGDLADRGVPPAFVAPPVSPITLAEVGPEAGPNGVIYTPGTIQGFVEPGSTGVAGEVTYNIISDPAGVPLPTSAWAGLALLTGLGAWRVIRMRDTI